MKEVTLQSPWPPMEGGRPPLDEYPRPALVRDRWMNLNGYWDYTVIPGARSAGIPREWEGKILVPFALETPLSGVRRPLGAEEVLWYHRRFTPDPSWKGRKILLHFEAVDYLCECFVNGRPAGEHRGGYFPFSFDITAFLKEGENSLHLKVTDPTDRGMQPRGKQVAEPGQIWYESTSGIWQTVWLEPVDSAGYVEGAACRWDEEGKTLTVEVKTAGTEGKTVSLEGTLGSPGKAPEVKALSAGGSLRFRIADPELWSPSRPALYDLKLRLSVDGRPADKVRSYAALRTVASAAGASGHRRIFLNGKPVFVNGLLDQGYWPESGMTAPSDRALVFDIEETKTLGFNCLRKHIKIESRRWYYHADRLGMLVIQDMVSGGKNRANPYLQIAFGIRRKDGGEAAYRKSGREDLAVRQEFEESVLQTLEHLKNHPSIICWVPFNESWGQFDARRIGETVSSADPTRLTDHASGWLDQGGGDFYSVHRYKLALKPRPGRERRLHMISEYGGYNLLVKDHVWDDCRKFGYGFYDTPEVLGAAYEKLIRRQLLPLMGKGLAAAIYTQLSDVEIESNGLFTGDRKVLKFPRELVRELNREIYKAFDAAEQREGEKSE